MKMKRIVVGLVASLLVASAFILSPVDMPDGWVQIGISKHPLAYESEGERLTSLPSYRADSTKLGQVSVIADDLTGLLLEDRLDDLLHADFNGGTKWPESLPDGFDPNKIMELGKDPGLNVRLLHERGITGQGVGVAIIDMSLLVDHVEYRDRLQHYEEINCAQDTSSYHGTAVASIAVGETTGVAPDADLYYIAQTTDVLMRVWYDFRWMAECVNRIVDINEQLPQDRKIRVLAIQSGWSWGHIGYTKMARAVERAKEAGIFVVSSVLYETYDNRMAFHGLGRDSRTDPNLLESYGPGEFWAESFLNGTGGGYSGSSLMFPMDSRTTASPVRQDDYVFYSRGGWSWTTPYIAGLYALACQVKPDVTPEEFWSVGLSTGDEVKIVREGRGFWLRKIVNPVKLIEELAGRNK